MNDRDIRQALLFYLRALYAGDESILVVEEVPICDKSSRVDVAVVGESLQGFEIKSQLDGLSRLSGQLLDYARVFDEVTLVIGVRHLGHILSELPSWCGIMIAQSVGGRVELETFRAPARNLSRDPYWLAQLLWRQEALSVLSRRGIDRGVRTKPRRLMWERMASLLSIEEIGVEVRRALIARPPAWRANLYHSELKSSVAKKAMRARRRKRRISASRRVS